MRGCLTAGVARRTRRIIRDAAQPLSASRGGEFYERVCAYLNEEPELGAGSVARSCRRAQGEFVAIPDAPPTVDGRR
jgi:hypothetical protein